MNQSQYKDLSVCSQTLWKRKRKKILILASCVWLQLDHSNGNTILVVKVFELFHCLHHDTETLVRFLFNNF